MRKGGGGICHHPLGEGTDPTVYLILSLPVPLTERERWVVDAMQKVSLVLSFKPVTKLSLETRPSPLPRVRTSGCLENVDGRAGDRLLDFDEFF